MDARLAAPGRHQALLGRTDECALLDGLLDAVRRGESRSLVLRGEAGIGKTALLEYLIDSGSDLTVMRAAGVEAEMELAFAGIHQLCGTMLDRLERAPGPAARRPESCSGLHRAVPDRFLVGLAVLGLLAAVAEERPLLCLVEDAQWLDGASSQIVGLVARRVHAESVAIVVAVREPAPRLRRSG